MESFSNDDLVKRWPNHKETTFITEHCWEIDQFRNKLGNNEIESSKFFVDGHDIQFQFKLQSRIQYDAEFIYISYYCFFGKEVLSEVVVSFDVSLIDSNGHNFCDNRKYYFL